MKGMVTKIATLLLMVCYSLSIIGFGVHTCSGSGESYVVTFVEGFECDDIHPEHHCDRSACCQHKHSCCDVRGEQCIQTMTCCSNDYQMLALTGTLSDDNKNGTDDPGLFMYGNCTFSNLFESNAEHFDKYLKPHCIAGSSCPGRMPDIQSLWGVWRI